ncbi:energy coupling factor transporter S component ThiW [Halobacillus salinarum]|uniref:Energy coupling factor transporter S component ThiW n=1 Tax=Halobacillus salinarum TaxID=2932257 RepID=A0ABY4EKV2_9BACI|nr:energy coupling factor transporter S component ThiW [Halobacillus salinarum]UOQ45099.1 energy coupling factor transporter S component ThiW [Halobacillus salinarum]
MKTRTLTRMAVLAAIGTLGSQWLWFPAGIAKAYPVQHAVNVIAAVTLGPLPAVGIAFVIGVLRNLLGIGTLLAFPGAMIGAFLSGILYRLFQRPIYSALGEVMGTGLIGSLVSVPYAHVLMGSAGGAFVFLPSFLISSFTGALIGWFLVVRMKPSRALPTF